jgi:hypothetical protein
MLLHKLLGVPLCCTKGTRLGTFHQWHPWRPGTFRAPVNIPPMAPASRACSSLLQRPCAAPAATARVTVAGEGQDRVPVRRLRTHSAIWLEWQL